MIKSTNKSISNNTNNSNTSYLDKIINSDIKSITNNKIKPKRNISNKANIKNTNKLTIKQQRFIDNYIINPNATEAALKAGYAKKTAYSIGADNLKKPQILEAIEKRLQKLEDKKIATATEVLQFLTSVIRGELEEDHVAVEGKGDGYSEARILKKKINPRDRLKGAELLAKRFGLLIEKVEIKDNRSDQAIASLLESLDGRKIEIDDAEDEEE